MDNRTLRNIGTTVLSFGQVPIFPKPGEGILNRRFNRASRMPQLTSGFGAVVLLHMAKHLHEKGRDRRRSPQNSAESPVAERGSQAGEDKRHRQHWRRDASDPGN